ncbi:MrcB family domain-containing protein [Clostridium botulinum]|uniref:MrcB family domain-containing protein n=1 Tax=Clostridium botulinum TaxID=1491 RepID=UPI000957B408|nr:DUF3578 domain-containing protein [Clostridium botulinum]APU60974.1 AAA domain family protein [Clostridium botulinum]
MSSWSKPNINNIISRKKVDLSVFKYGVHIPMEYRKDFLNIIPNGYIPQGKAEKIVLDCDDFSAEVEMRNVNVKSRNDDVLQIRYSSSSNIAKYLKDKFKKSYSILMNSNIKDEDYIKEYIEFYKSDEPYKLKLKLIVDEESTYSIKQEFLKYIGDKNSLSSNYQKSYKLILLIELLNNADNLGKGKYEKICADIANYYIERYRKELLAESSDSKIVKNINNLSVHIVKSVMNENAYKIINDKNYIYKEKINGEEYLCFNQELWNSLSKEDTRNLKSILHSKLDFYYKERVKHVENNSLKKFFQQVINDYVNVRIGEDSKGHKLGGIVRHDIPGYLKDLDFIDKDIYRIKGSVGQGNWAKVPWVALMNKSITTTTQNGVYVVYLFSEKMDKLYLTLNQGVTEYVNNFKRLANEKLRENGDRIREQLSLNNSDFKNPILLGQGDLAKYYEAGAIATIEYDSNDLPNDSVLKEDLAQMIRYYEKYVNKNKEEELEIKDIIENIHKYILSKGYTYNIDLIKNYYLSLKTKPFVLLSGISGTGKSKLVQLFAESIGSNFENGRFTIIPVRPDWSDPSDLLGYKNIEGKFLPGPLTNVISRAVTDPTKLYFVCLDEMNLARVEYYFSDILSLMETRCKKCGNIITEKIFKSEVFGQDKEALETYKDLYIPENLYIVGTVNMDETTFPFSKKVLDRANTIEFNEVDLNINFEYFNSVVEESEVLNISKNYIVSKYLKVVDCLDKREHIEKILIVLNKINDELKEINHHFAYRVRDEVIFYVLYALEYELMNIDEALDYAIRQKILPRVQGSNINVKAVLINLYKLFSEDSSKDLDIYDNTISEKIINYIKENKVKYPLSSEKVSKMIRRFDLDGFTTFWE